MSTTEAGVILLIVAQLAAVGVGYLLAYLDTRRPR